MPVSAGTGLHHIPLVNQAVPMVNAPWALNDGACNIKFEVILASDRFYSRHRFTLRSTWRKWIPLPDGFFLRFGGFQPSFGSSSFSSQPIAAVCLNSCVNWSCGQRSYGQLGRLRFDSIVHLAFFLGPPACHSSSFVGYWARRKKAPINAGGVLLPSTDGRCCFACSHRQYVAATNENDFIKGDDSIDSPGAAGGSVLAGGSAGSSSAVACGTEIDIWSRKDCGMRTVASRNAPGRWISPRSSGNLPHQVTDHSEVSTTSNRITKAAHSSTQLRQFATRATPAIRLTWQLRNGVLAKPTSVTPFPPPGGGIPYAVAYRSGTHDVLSPSHTGGSGTACGSFHSSSFQSSSFSNIYIFAQESWVHTGDLQDGKLTHFGSFLGSAYDCSDVAGLLNVYPLQVHPKGLTGVSLQPNGNQIPGTWMQGKGSIALASLHAMVDPFPTGMQGKGGMQPQAWRYLLGYFVMVLYGFPGFRNGQ
jgi:hypothetical protein